MGAIPACLAACHAVLPTASSGWRRDVPKLSYPALSPPACTEAARLSAEQAPSYWQSVHIELSAEEALALVAYTSSNESAGGRIRSIATAGIKAIATSTSRVANTLQAHSGKGCPQVG